MEGLKGRKITLKAFLKNSFRNISRFSYRNKFVSFLLFMTGAVLVTSIFPGDFTPTAAQRVQWRREKLKEEQEEATQLSEKKEK